MDRWGYVAVKKPTWTDVKTKVKRYVDFGNPLTRKFDGEEYVCLSEWATDRRPKYVVGMRSGAMAAGLHVRIVKGRTINQRMNLLSGHATEAMYVRPKNLKDQNALHYILGVISDE